jgi:hypothetical protein
LGWGFALWYVFSNRSKITTDNDFVKINRIVSYAPGGVWGKGTQFTDLVKIESLVRNLCAEKIFTDKLAAPINFLKGKQYYIGKTIGKKPRRGVFLTEELEFLLQEYEERIDILSDSFEKYLKDWQRSDRIGLGHLLSELVVKPSKDSKIIMKTGDARIPDLLVSEGQGRKKKNKIVSGTDLYVKLKSIYGGSNIRTAAKVLWSPLYKVNQTIFVTASLMYGKYKISFVKSDRDLIPKNVYDWVEKSNFKEELTATAINAIDSVAALYVELFDMNSESSAWRNYFL